jgi:hypothetical protein
MFKTPSPQPVVVSITGFICMLIYEDTG